MVYANSTDDFCFLPSSISCPLLVGKRIHRDIATKRTGGPDYGEGGGWGGNEEICR